MVNLQKTTRQEVLDELWEIDPDNIEQYLELDNGSLENEYRDFAKHCLRDQGFDGIKIVD